MSMRIEHDLLGFVEVPEAALFKIAGDFRLLSSGPEAGLGELRLPALQPGSSIMPTKVNPVMPEFLISISFRVLGNHAMCAAGLDHGELDLNVWESSMVFSILESMELLGSGVSAVTQKCVSGLAADLETNRRHTDTIIPRLTRLVRVYGYQRVTEVCKKNQAATNLAAGITNLKCSKMHNKTQFQPLYSIDKYLSENNFFGCFFTPLSGVKKHPTEIFRIGSKSSSHILLR